MRKRILAILLAGLMVFDSQSISALAVEPETAVVAETSDTEPQTEQEQETEKPAETQEESSASETSETETGGESSEAPESSETPKEETSEPESESESQSVEQTENSEAESSEMESSEGESSEGESSEGESLEIDPSETETSEVESSEEETESETETVDATEEETEQSTEEELLGITSGDFEYSLSGSEATITEYTGSDVNVTVPETIDGNKVVAIGYGAFQYQSKIKTVVLPDTVTSIGSSAFYNCTSLTGVTLSANLTSIGSSAFYYCKALTGVNLPASLTSIEGSAFYNCTSLTDVTLPANLTSIGSSAFKYCKALTGITFPASLTSVGSYAFANCEALVDIVFSDSATSIGNHAFANCGAIQTVDIRKNNQIGNYCFNDCTGITDIVIGDDVTLGDYVFNGCSNVKSLQLGQNLTKTDWSFSGISIGGQCGSNLSWRLNLDQGSLVIDGYGLMEDFTVKGGAPWQQFGAFIKTVRLSSGATSVSPYAFKDLECLEGIVLPQNITSIGEQAFFSCDNLKSVEIPATVKTIGELAFSECMNLSKIVFCGDAPSLGADCIPDINTLTAYYPETASGWTDRLMAKYPNVNWQPWDNTIASKDVVLVLDTSGSMSDKMDTLKEAASRFVDAVGGTMYNTRISIVEYDSSASVICDFSTDKNELLSKINMLSSGGGTNYATALNKADSVMQQSTAKYRCIVMFSDGEPNDSEDRIREIAAKMGQSYYMYSVGLISSYYYGDSQRQILVDVAGSEERYFEASDIDSLVEAFLALADDLGKSEDTVVEIKRHNQRRDLLTNKEEFCVNSPETVSIYVTPGTKYTDAKKVVLEQNGQVVLAGFGSFDNIMPGTLFTKGQGVRAKLYDSKNNLLESLDLKIEMRDHFVITYRLNGETDEVYTTQKVINGQDITPPENPVLPGYNFKGWYSSKACAGMPFFDNFNINNRLEIEGDQTLYAKWKVDKGSFDLARDAWSFRNIGTFFCVENFYDLPEIQQKKYKHEISSGDYATLLSELGFGDKCGVKHVKRSSWTGSCFGMSAAVCLAKDGTIDISHFDASVPDIGSATLNVVRPDKTVGPNIDGDKDVGNIESMINFYHCMQVVGSIHDCWKDSIRWSESERIQKIIDKLQSTDKLAILYIMTVDKNGNENGFHDVVAYNFANGTKPDTYTFEVYDCSIGNNISYPVKISKNNGQFTVECSEWEHTWSSACAGFKLLAVMTVDDLKQEKLLVAPGVMTANAGSSSQDSNVYEMTTSYQNFTISDGNNSAVIKNGKLSEGSLAVECYGCMNEPGMTPEYCFELPVLGENSSYTITAEDAGSYETTMCYDHSANGFFVSHEAQAAGKITISPDGTISTQYAEKTKQNITVGINGAKTPWYYAEIEVEDSGVTVSVQDSQIDVKTTNESEMNINLENDFNVIQFDNVKVDSTGVSVVEGSDGACDIKKGEGVIASNGFGHSVVFDSQCGTSVDTLLNVQKGSLIAEPDDPTRDGYIFEGWYKEKSCDTLWNFTKDKVTEDTILYAGWSIDPNYFVSVTFSIAGEENQSIYLTKGEQIEESQCPEIAGNKDKKWYRDDHYTIAWDFENDSVMENTVLYAKGKDCSIAFVTDCSAKIDAYTVYAGSYLPEPETEMEKDGYTLCGWYADADFDESWNFKNDKVVGDTTLYAKWIPNERDKDGNDTKISIEIVRPNTYQYSGKAIKPDIVVRDGDKILRFNKDYKVSYKNNTSACDITSPDVKDSKKPQVIVQGIGDYKSGKKFVKYFSIQQADFAGLTITVPEYVAAKANDKLQQIKPVVKINNATVPAKDYSVGYYKDAECKESVGGLGAVGTYYVVVEARKNADGTYIGNYAGKSEAFKVDVVNAELSLSSAKVAYSREFKCVSGEISADKALQGIISKVTLGKDVYATSDLENFRQYFTVSAIDANGAIVSQARLAKVLKTAGTKTVMISAVDGNPKGYVGSKSVTITVKGATLSKNQFKLTYDKATSKAVTSVEYTGKAQVPSIYSDLINGKDYTVSYLYQKNPVSTAQIVNAGKYTAVIKGINQYSGTVSISFTISPVNLAKAYAAKKLTITSKDTPSYQPDGANAVFSIAYDPDGSEGSVYAKTTLKELTDYTVSYKNNKKATNGRSLAYGVITGKGNFTGTLKGDGKTGSVGKTRSGIARELNFSVSKKSLSSSDISVVVHTVTFKKGKPTVRFTLYDNGHKIASKEYRGRASAYGTSVSLSISAKGVNYTGSLYRTLQADLAKVTDAKSVQIAYKDSGKYYYTGSQITPEITVTDANGNDISSNVTVTYGENTKIGQGTIVITGKLENGYCDRKVLKFTILPKWMKWMF